MAVSKERLLARHQEVRAEFKKLQQAKRLRYNAILETLARKYHYSEKRIEEIIAMKDTDPVYGNPNQLKMFDHEGQ